MKENINDVAKQLVSVVSKEVSEKENRTKYQINNNYNF